MDLFLIGAGGHAKVVLAAAQAAGRSVHGIVDDDPAQHGTRLLGVPVVGGLEALPPRVEVVVCVGDNAARQRIVARLDDRAWATLVHPRAWVHASARLGAGTVVIAGAVVQPDARIGAHAIVNTSASVDHDAVLGDFVHVAPGARLAGGVRLGDGAFVGLGAQVLPGRTVGAWATVGAGGTVLRDVEPGTTVVGVPARPLPGAISPR